MCLHIRQLPPPDPQPPLPSKSCWASRFINGRNPISPFSLHTRPLQPPCHSLVSSPRWPVHCFAPPRPKPGPGRHGERSGAFETIRRIATGGPVPPSARSTVSLECAQRKNSTPADPYYRPRVFASAAACRSLNDPGCSQLWSANSTTKGPTDPHAAHQTKARLKAQQQPPKL